MKTHKIFLLLLLFLVGCSPTLPEGYSHFPAEMDSIIPISFDHPANWEIISGEYGLTINDPNAESNVPEELEGDRKGSIYISKSWGDTYSLEDIKERVTNEYSDRNGYEIIRIEEVVISKKPGLITKLQVIAPIILPDGIWTEFNLISETYYIELADGIYSIDLIMPEVDRENKFGKNFDYLIETLEVHD